MENTLKSAFFFTEFLNFSDVLRLKFNIQSLVFKYQLVKINNFRWQNSQHGFINAVFLFSDS